MSFEHNQKNSNFSWVGQIIQMYSEECEAEANIASMIQELPSLNVLNMLEFWIEYKAREGEMPQPNL